MNWKIIYYSDSVQEDILEMPAGILAYIYDVQK